MSFNLTDPILITWRKGTVDDPYSYRQDTVKIVNNIIVLTEIPDPYNHVTVSGYTEIYDGTPTSSQFIVDYEKGVVTFNASENAKQVTANYRGRGLIQYPAERIYARSPQDTNIVNDLQSIVESSWTGGGTVQSITSTTQDLVISNGNVNPNITINTGTGANQIVKLDSSGKVSASILNAGVITGDITLQTADPSYIFDVSRANTSKIHWDADTTGDRGIKFDIDGVADVLNIQSNGLVQTKSGNQLDDGSSNLLVKGKANLQGLLNVTGGTGRIVLNTIDVNNKTWIGTGSATVGEPNALAIGFTTDGAGKVTGINLGAAAGQIVQTIQNILDNGNGDMHIAGSIYGLNNAMWLDTALNINTVSTAGSGTAWNVKGKGKNSDLQVLVDGTHVVNTYNSTLDDGSGYMYIPGAVYSKNTEIRLAFADSTKTAKWGVYANSGAVGIWDWANNKIGLQYNPSYHSIGLGAAASNVSNSVVTMNNTLDDGSGALKINGNFSLIGAASLLKGSRTSMAVQNGSSKTYFELYNNAVANGTAVNGGAIQYTENGANYWEISHYAASAGTTTAASDNLFFKYDGTGSVGTKFSIFGSGKVSTLNNILDDGTGASQFSGIIKQSGFNVWSDDYTKRGYCYYTANATLALVANTWAKVQFNTLITDHLSEFSTTNYRFQPKIGGNYNIQAFASLGGQTSGATMYLAVYKNGTAYCKLALKPSTGVTEMIGGGATLELLSTDYVEIFAMCTSAANVNGTADTYVMITREL